MSEIRRKTNQISGQNKFSKSLCWTCQNAVASDKHGCMWSRYLIPVKGAVMKGNRVDECPEYSSDEVI